MQLGKHPFLPQGTRLQEFTALSINLHRIRAEVYTGAHEKKTSLEELLGVHAILCAGESSLKLSRCTLQHATLKKLHYSSIGVCDEYTSGPLHSQKRPLQL